MAKGRAAAIVLAAGEKSELTALTRKHGAPQALAERARIVLAVAAGLNNKEIASKVAYPRAREARRDRGRRRILFREYQVVLLSYGVESD